MQKTKKNNKKIIFAFFAFIAIVLIVYYFIYPAPGSRETVGTIAGAERAERHRDERFADLELDENELNQFLQSAEWQNLSRNPEFLNLLKDDDFNAFINLVNFSILVQQYQLVLSEEYKKATEGKIPVEAWYHSDEFSYLGNSLDSVFDRIVLLIENQPEFQRQIFNFENIDSLKELVYAFGLYNLGMDETRLKEFSTIIVKQLENFPEIVNIADNQVRSEFWSSIYERIILNIDLDPLISSTLQDYLVLQSPFNNDDFMKVISNEFILKYFILNFDNIEKFSSRVIW